MKRRTKCVGCGSIYDYEKSEDGTSITCACGQTVHLPAQPAPKNARIHSTIGLGVAITLLAAVAWPIYRAFSPADHNSTSGAAPTPPVSATIPGKLTQPVSEGRTITVASATAVARAITPNDFKIYFDMSLLGAGTLWSLGTHENSDEKYKLIDCDLAKQNVAKYVENEDLFTQQVIKLHPKECADIIETSGLGAVGFLAQKSIFRIAQDDKHQLVCMCLAAASGTEYNTLRSTDRSRSSTVFKDKLESQLKYMHRDASKFGAKRVAVAMTYGVRDFSEKFGGSGETLAIVANIEDIAAFDDDKITEDAFAAKCEVFLNSNSNLRRIELKFD